MHYPGPDDEPVVGQPARRVRVLKPAQTVYSIKRFMGRRGNEIAPGEKQMSYPVRGEGSGPVTVDLPGQARTPEEISADILKNLRRDAEKYFNEPVTRGVITVPAYFNDAQRNATKKAGELAGFTVERIINEPTAAALAYGLDKLKEHARIAVYDLGGGTFDLSICSEMSGLRCSRCSPQTETRGWAVMTLTIGWWISSWKKSRPPVVRILSRIPSSSPASAKPPRRPRFSYRPRRRWKSRCHF